MMEAKDWLSFFVGLVVAAAGILPILSHYKIGPTSFALPWLPVNIFAYFVAGFGFYLMVNSVIEITNSNSIGWLSFLVAILFLAAGVLKVLFVFKIGSPWFELKFINGLVYNIIFAIEGIFLMIACFAMEI